MAMISLVTDKISESSSWLKNQELSGESTSWLRSQEVDEPERLLCNLSGESIKESEEDTYIELCRTIGSLTDWVQSTGGNISVKNKDLDLLLIKTSGTRLINCDFQTYSLKMIEEIVCDKSKSLPKGASIETYFHTFPAKCIVHLHPGPALDFLTKYEDSTFTIEYEEIDSHTLYKTLVFESYNVIDYEKPGYDLYEKLLPYKNEKIVILKNHGVLIMDETIDDIIKHMKNIELAIFSKIKICSDILFVHMFRKMLKEKFTKHKSEKVDLILKPFLMSLNGFVFHERIFFPFTPDHSVFLTNAPLAIEINKSEFDSPERLLCNLSGLTKGLELCSSPLDSEHNVWNIEFLSKELDKHLKVFKEFPTIICVNGFLYTLSKTFDGCLGLEEMLYSYFCITSKDKRTNHLSESEVSKLKSWSSEIERRKKLGLDFDFDSDKISFSE